jgi:hypothetical protein
MSLKAKVQTAEAVIRSTQLDILQAFLDNNNNNNNN